MAATLKIKNSSTPTTTPTGLTAGEMAINLADKKLYVGGTAGTNVVFLDSTSSVGLGTANTFTQLNTFSAGISASGATFNGSISGATATFSKDITVNSMTVGLGKSSETTNVAIGYVALASNTSDGLGAGEYNTAIGGSALTTNTSGTSNTAIGYGTLSSNTSGENNIAIGLYALTNSTTANTNTAIGGLALAYGTLGSFNIGIGYDTLSAAGNTGNSNVAVGYQSLKTNTTGVNNVGMGYRSLYLDTTGLDNTGIGTSALQQNTTGSNNTGVGSSALRQLTTASQMTALGNNAGRFRGTGTDTNTTGTGGIYIGYQARGSTLAQTNEIVIGVDALGLGSNTAVIGATLQSAATIYGVLNLPKGLSASGATFMGNISAPNIVTSFNGATGTVTGASLGANTFTALNTFSAGISASGATFGGTVNLQDNTLSRVEFLDYFERFVDLGDFATKGAQIPIDLSTAQVFRTKLTLACTGLTLTNVPDNGNANAVGFSLLFVGDGTARTMTWNIGSTAASWAGGTAPTYTSTLNKIDVFSFLSRDGGSTWLGFVGGQNF